MIVEIVRLLCKPLKNNKYLILSFILFLIIFLPFMCFAKDGQIDIDEIIRMQNAQKEALQKLNSTLNQLNGRYDYVTRNEDDEIVKDDDTSDEINIDYFKNILTDEDLLGKVKNLMCTITTYISNEKSSNEINSSVWFYLLNNLIVFGFSLALCSLSTVTAREASYFPIVRKENFTDLSQLDTKVSLISENKYAVKIDVDDNEILTNKQSNNSKISDYESVKIVVEQALQRLKSKDNENLKLMYSHFKKSRVLSGRALEDSIQELCESNSNLNDNSPNSVFESMIIIKNINMYSGNGINHKNPLLSSLDMAYLSTISNSNNKENIDNKLWAENSLNS